MMDQDLFCFNLVWFPIWVVKVECSIFQSKGHILSIPTLYFKDVMVLEMLFANNLSKNVGLSSRLCFKLFLLLFFLYCTMLDILGLSGLGIIFIV